MGWRVRVLAAPLGAAVLALTGCTGGQSEAEPRPSESTTPASTSSPTAPTGQTADPSSTAQTTPPLGPPVFRADAAMATVRHLAGDIGPRLATGPAFARAADWVQKRFEAYGYMVSRQRVQVPAGDSWGVPVGAGSSTNVIATPRGFDPTSSWRLVGAHLDTVAVAPGAEDNASGVGVMLELARLAARRPTALPTMFVAFAAEEPRGEGDDLHHFGSTLHVRRLPTAQRAALRAMVALDRVGVGDGGVVPLCIGGLSPLRVRDQLAVAGRRLGIGTSRCADNTASDHWSYEKVGVPVSRVGGTPYAGYHSAGDVVAVVQPAQLGRVGRLMWAWLRP